MAATEASISAVLGERARHTPNLPAYTFIDYDGDPEGYSQTLTWSQLHQRARVVAAEIASCTAPADRVAILAPQGLEYIIGFFAAIEAGCLAVALSAPPLRAPRGPG